jgi:hypothetical protein
VEHTWPAAQTWPQVPQLPLSVCSFTQTPEQLVRPAWHESWHVPEEHTWPATHA